MKTFEIPVSWEASGFVKIEANSLEEAIEIFDEKEDEISDGTIKLCSTILAKIAITLKGEPMELARHGYHDLPELVAVLHLENELNKVQMEEMLTAMRSSISTSICSRVIISYARRLQRIKRGD